MPIQARFVSATHIAGALMIELQSSRTGPGAVQIRLRQGSRQIASRRLAPLTPTTRTIGLRAPKPGHSTLS